MAALDRNIIIIALPAIAFELNTSIITLVWIAIGYWVVTASMLLTFGRLADMFGRVRLYNLGFALFTFGSALCFLSQTGEQLVAFRIIQAVGAAFLFSNSAAILTDVFSESERGRALGFNQISIVIGSVVGLVLGGFLTYFFGWRSIFLINLPIGIFATVWAFYKLKDFGTIKKEKIDWFGNITFSSGILLLLVGITFGSFHLLDTIGVSVCVISGIVLLILFYYIEKKQVQPMLDLSLFRNYLFLSSSIVIFLNALARGAFTFVMVFYLQGPGMALNPLAAGIYLLPVSLAMAIFAPISGWFYDKYQLQILTQIGLVVSAIGFLILTQINITIVLEDSLLALVLVGAGLGIFASPNRATIMNSVSSYRRGVAASASTTLVMIGSAFSIGIIFLVFSNLLPLNFVEYIFSGNVTDGSEHYNFETPEMINRFQDSVSLIFLISAGIMIVSVIIQIYLTKIAK